MAKMTSLEKKHLERLFGMGTGWVLSFTDRTFNDYFYETFGIDVTSEKYIINGSSKANRLRSIWALESNLLVSKVISDFIDLWESNKDQTGTGLTPEEKNLRDECRKISTKLKEELPVDDIGALTYISSEKEFLILIDQIRSSIEKDNPEAALDRLHTYLVKYLREICNRKGIPFDKSKPLNSILGEYINWLRNNGKIRTLMAERILKTSISVIEAFNSVRNDHSFAHDNPILGFNESLLIINNITNLVRFLGSLEK